MAYCTLADLKEQIKEDELAGLTDDRINLVSTTANGAITAAATSITLTDSTGFPSVGRIEIGYEQIDYTANASNILSGCIRGANNTTADGHSTGSTVTEKNYIQTAVITRAIADSDAEIDGYCSTKYADLPFSTVPVMIRKISVDIAIYNLFSRRRGATEDRLQRYKDAIKFLSNVANGTVSMGGDAPAEDSDAGPEAITYGTKTDITDRVFSMGKTSAASVGSLDNY